MKNKLLHGKISLFLVTMALFIMGNTSVYSQSPDPIDRTGWVVTASNNNGNAGKAIDGDASSRWDTGTVQVAGQWFMADMLTARTCNEIILDYAASASDGPANYSVYTSTDGTTWGTAVASGTQANAKLEIHFPEVSAQYIKITQDGTAGGYWSIHELNVLNIPTDAPVEGVTLSPATATISNPILLVTVVTPSYAANKKVTYSSSNTSVATVNAQGNVTTVGDGTTTITVTTEDGAKTATSEITVVLVPQAPFGGIPAALPGTVEMENYDDGGEGFAYHETTPLNIPGKGRTDQGVDVENCSLGGLSLGYNEPGEWIEYTVEVAKAGYYTFDFRVASPNEGAGFKVLFDNEEKTGIINVPNTGGWQNWDTISVSGIYLNSGVQVMRYASLGGFNFDRIEIKSALLDRTDWIVTASNNSGSAGNAIDGDASSRWDTQGVQVAGQWFMVDMLKASAFNEIILDYAASSNDGPASYNIYTSSDGENWGEPVATGTAVPKMLDVFFPEVTAQYIKITQDGTAGGYWSIHELEVLSAPPVSVNGVTLSPAADTITNSLQLVTAFLPAHVTNPKISYTSSDPTIATVDANGLVAPVSKGIVTITVTTEDGEKTATAVITCDPVIQSPFGGITAAIPGIVEVENYDDGGEGISYHDTTPLNIPGKGRATESVDIEDCGEGGLSMGYNESGEWIEYTVDVATSGLYSIDFRVASPNEGAGFSLSFNGEDKTGVINVPNTGGWQTWISVNVKVSLDAGVQVMRYNSLGGFNFNKMTFANTTGIAPIDAADISLLVYPNPATEYAQLEIKHSMAEKVNYKVFSLSGQLVLSKELSLKAGVHIEKMNLGSLENGLYIVKVNGMNWCKTQQLNIVK